MTTAGWVSSIKTTPTIIKKSWSTFRMSETGSSEHEANGGMKTKITIVDGVDGLTPDMVRVFTDGNPKTTPPTTQSSPDYDVVVQDASEAVILTYTNYVWSPRKP